MRSEVQNFSFECLPSQGRCFFNLVAARACAAEKETALLDIIVMSNEFLSAFL